MNHNSVNRAAPGKASGSYNCSHGQIVTLKSRIRETKNLSTDADSRTVTILERLLDLSEKKNEEEKN